MMRILHIEWLKIRKYRAFIVLAILSAAGVAGANYMVYSVADTLQVTAGPNPLIAAALGKPFDVPNVWHTVTWVSGFLQVLPGLLMIMLVCNEYNFKTNRQNVIDGLSREEFMWGKIALGVLMALAMSVMVFITACIFGAIGKGGFSFEGMEYIGRYFIQSLSHIGVAMVIATLLRRSGVAIVIYLLYAFLFEGILSMILIYRVETTVGLFLPLKSSDKLITMPTMIGTLMPTKYNIAPGWLATVAMAWVILEMWFCRWRFCRKDL